MARATSYPVSVSSSHRAPTRALAGWLAVLALVSLAPLLVLMGEPPQRRGWPPWASVVGLIAVLQLAWTIYLWQLTDFSSLAVAAAGCGLVAAFYAMLFGWSLRAAPADEIVLSWQLAPYLAGGRLAAWSFLMLCLHGLWSYASGKRAARWRQQAQVQTHT